MEKLYIDHYGGKYHGFVYSDKERYLITSGSLSHVLTYARKHGYIAVEIF